MVYIEVALINELKGFSRVSKYCVASIKVRSKLGNMKLFRDIALILILKNLQPDVIVLICAAELNTTNW